MTESRDPVPLFPLGLVLLPHMPLPLHVFEQRYQTLVERCIEEERPFGVVLAGSRQIQQYGCIARIDRVLERYDDGRFDILTVGTRRFRTVSTDSSLPYLVAQVDYYGDQDESQVDAYRVLARDTVKKLEIYAAMVGGTVDRETLLVLGPQKLSFVAAASSIFTIEQKQTMLQMLTVRERLQYIHDSIDQAIVLRRMTRAAQRVIGETSDISHMLN